MQLGRRPRAAPTSGVRPDRARAAPHDRSTASSRPSSSSTPTRRRSASRWSGSASGRRRRRPGPPRRGGRSSSRARLVWSRASTRSPASRAGWPPRGPAGPTRRCTGVESLAPRARSARLRCSGRHTPAAAGWPACTARSPRGPAPPAEELRQRGRRSRTVGRRAGPPRSGRRPPRPTARGLEPHHAAIDQQGVPEPVARAPSQPVEGRAEIRLGGLELALAGPAEPAALVPRRPASSPARRRAGTRRSRAAVRARGTRAGAGGRR